MFLAHGLAFFAAGIPVSFPASFLYEHSFFFFLLHLLSETKKKNLGSAVLTSHFVILSSQEFSGFFEFCPTIHLF